MVNFGRFRNTLPVILLKATCMLNAAASDDETWEQAAQHSLGMSFFLMVLTLNHDCSHSWSVSVRFVANTHLLRKRWQAILLSLPYAILVIVFAWDLLSTGANEKRFRPTQVLYAARPDWMSSKSGFQRCLVQRSASSDFVGATTS